MGKGAINKVMDITTVLHSAYELACGLDGVVSVAMDDGKIRVLLNSLEALEQIPGELHTKSINDRYFDMEAWKYCHDIEFVTYFSKEDKNENS